MSRVFAKFICSAVEDEIKYLRDQEAFPQDILLQPLGIGFLDAALNLEKILEKLILESSAKPEQIIFVGTCGSYKDNLQIGDIVSISSVGLLNLGSLQGISYSPHCHPEEHHEVMRREDLSAMGSLQEPQSGSLRMTQNALCLSSLEISRDPKIAELVCAKYSDQEFIVENMELYGVAEVCARYQIALSALLGVTNYIDANAHEDWLKHNKAVAEKINTVILRSITK